RCDLVGARRRRRGVDHYAKIRPARGRRKAFVISWADPSSVVCGRGQLSHTAGAWCWGQGSGVLTTLVFYPATHAAAASLAKVFALARSATKQFRQSFNIAVPRCEPAFQIALDGNVESKPIIQLPATETIQRG